MVVQQEGEQEMATNWRYIFYLPLWKMVELLDGNSVSPSAIPFRNQHVFGIDLWQSLHTEQSRKVQQGWKKSHGALAREEQILDLATVKGREMRLVWDVWFMSCHAVPHKSLSASVTCVLEQNNSAFPLSREESSCVSLPESSLPRFAR